MLPGPETRIRKLTRMVILWLCVWPGLFYGQHPDNLFSPRGMQKDLLWLQRKVLRYHPACRDSIRSDSVRQAFEMAQYEAEKPLTELQFLRLLRKTLNATRCGHTTALPSRAFFSYYRKALPKPVFPLQVYQNRKGMFVRFNGSNDSSIAVGDRILTLNQEPVDSLVSELLEILPGDGYHNTFKLHHLSLDFPTYYLFLRGPSYSYSAGLADSTGKFSTHVFSLRSQGKARTHLSPSRSTQIILQDKYRELSLLRANGQVACLKIFAFGGTSSFYRRAFAILRERGVERLVLDLRGNAGGNLFNASELLRYLLPDTFSMCFRRKQEKIRFNHRSHMSLATRLTLESFRWFPSARRNLKPICRAQNGLLENRFFFRPEEKRGYRGNMVVLINGGTFSAAAMVAAYLRKKAGIRLIGEESGGAAQGFNAMITPTLHLRHTRMRVSLPLFEIDYETGRLPFRGLIPDYTMGADIARTVKGLDQELEFLARNFDSFR